MALQVDLQIDPACSPGEEYKDGADTSSPREGANRRKLAVGTEDDVRKYIAQAANNIEDGQGVQGRSLDTGMVGSDHGCSKDANGLKAIVRRALGPDKGLLSLLGRLLDAKMGGWRETNSVSQHKKKMLPNACIEGKGGRDKNECIFKFTSFLRVSHCSMDETNWRG